MTERDDMTLLREFAATESEGAFAALAERHVNLVYSTALRGVGNAHAAQEITQAVFIILARKAKSLSAKTILSGWLYQTTRLTAANFLRGEIRRQKREQEAYMQSTLNEPDADAWPQIAPLLDDALGKLGERDRHAIVLRFFENKNLREVGVALGASEDAAKMRVNRALEKLRKFFTKRGVALSALAIAGAVSANSVQAAPAGLAKSVTAVAIAKGSIALASILTLVKETMKTMTWLKIKFAIGAGAAALVLGGAAIGVLSGDESGNRAHSASSAVQFRVVLDAAAANSEALTYSVTNSESGEVSRETLHVQLKVLLDQSAIASAAVSTNPAGRRQIDFMLTPEGRTQFANVTRQNIGRRLAIIVDSQVISAPMIRSEITGGKGQISGNFTEEEAKTLAAKISKPAAQ